MYGNIHLSQIPPEVENKIKTTINTTYCRVLAIQTKRTAMKTSVQNFYLYKDDIREETLAYPVVDDVHQHEPVR